MLARRGAIGIALFCVLVLKPAVGLSAVSSCPWVPTLDKSPEEVAKIVEEKSGKKPTKSCGVGADFKVCHECATKLSPVQWSRIRWLLAEPTYRDWHFEWHGNSVADARTLAQKKGGDEAAYQGENFFYMHREIVRNVQANLSAMNLPCIAPWDTLPSKPDDREFPVLGATRKARALPRCKAIDPSGSKLKQLQTSEAERKAAERALAKFEEKKMVEINGLTSPLARMEAKERFEQEKFRSREKILANLKVKPPKLSPDEIDTLLRCVDDNTEKDFASLKSKIEAHNSSDFFLKNSLGKVGREIEESWHTGIHNLYDTEQPAHCDEESVEPECDSMRDGISSHVNMNFYKVHGLVDKYVEKWLKLNGYDLASKDCKGKEKCYEWKSTYVGEPPGFVNGSDCKMVLGPNGIVAANRARASGTSPVKKAK
jgi:hypothetical protein